jgi:hypothetical protein
MRRSRGPCHCKVILSDDARSRADWFPREFEILSDLRLEQLKRLHDPQREAAYSRRP